MFMKIFWCMYNIIKEWQWRNIFFPDVNLSFWRWKTEGAFHKPNERMSLDDDEFVFRTIVDIVVFSWINKSSFWVKDNYLEWLLNSTSTIHSIRNLMSRFKEQHNRWSIWRLTFFDVSKKSRSFPRTLFLQEPFDMEVQQLGDD